MDDAHASAEEQATSPETPEDVAILYSWANLPSAKYRDFSASRREYRAQQRARAAEAQRAAELEAARQIEETARRELEQAQQQLERTKQAEADADADATAQARAEEALRRAEERAAAERQEALRREEAAEALRLRAERARSEMLEARRRAEEQASRYAEAEEPSSERDPAIPGEMSDPYHYTGQVDPAYFAATPGVRTARAARASTERKSYGYSAHRAQDSYENDSLSLYHHDSTFAATTGRSPKSSKEAQEGSQEPVAARALRSGAIVPGMPETLGGHERREETGREPDEAAAAGPDARPVSQRAQAGEVQASSEQRSSLSSFEPPSFRDAQDLHAAGTLPSFREYTTSAEDERAPAGTNGLREDGRAHAASDRVEVPEPSGRGDSNGDDQDAARSSRMFLPGPRPRILPVDPHLRQASKGAGRPHRAALLHEIARSAEERLLGAPHAGTAPPISRNEDEDARGEIDPVPPEVQEHRSMYGRDGENSVRRRREGVAASSIARTTRQPRLEVSSQRTFANLIPEDSALPPAWLSPERREQGWDMSLSSDHDFGGYGMEPLSPALPIPQAVFPAGYAAAQRARESALQPVPAEERWRPPSARGTGATSQPDTLQQSRERVASRWFALSGLMGEESPAEARSAPPAAPHLCVFSISGGVGKTSIVGTLGRALSSLGEQVLLVETSVHGILPYYFGARETRPGSMRSFMPPEGFSDSPIKLMSYDADGLGNDEKGKDEILDDLSRRAEGVKRVLLDVSISSAWMARRLAQQNPWILVPVAPDMNAILGTQAVERLFVDVVDRDGRPVRPYYVLNQYDSSLPLHLDVREVLRQVLGERLLPIMLHRTPAISEALAEGMTVIDYAPGSPNAEDYVSLAAWVRRLAGPATEQPRSGRWSER